MSHCKPLNWIWGLPPLLFVTLLALYGVPLQIERDLSARTETKLRDAGHAWASARFDGRDATLEGLSFSRTELDRALETIGAVWGVRKVEDRTKLIASPETYTWWAIKKERRLKIRGHVPTKKVRRTILGFVKAAMPDLEVDDKMVLAGGSPPPKLWLGSVSFALLQLGQLRSGTIHLAGNSLKITGEAETAQSFQAVKTALTKQLPAGMTLAENVVTPPVVDPFSWRVKYLNGVVSLNGYVPDEAAKARILMQARNLFPDAKVNDEMELAVGAPEGWLWAVSASLIQLHRLESGRVRLKGTRLEIEGIAADKKTAQDVAASIRHGLPSSYRTTEIISISKKPKPAEVPTNGRSG